MTWGMKDGTQGAKHWKGIGSATLLALTIACSTGALAQEARSPLNIERDIATLNQQIVAKQQQVNTLRDRPSPEQSELNAVQRTLNQARAAYQANASADNEGKAHNAEFKVKLVEIKYNKAHADVNALVDDIDKLKSQLASKQREAKEATKQIAEQQKANERQQQQKASDEQAKHRQQEQELQRTKQEAEAQQKEIQRLKAELAAKAAPPAAPVKPIEVAKPAPTAAVSSATPSASTNSTTAAPSPAAPASAAATGASIGIIRLQDQQQVAHELQQLEQRVAGVVGDRGANESLYLKRPDVKTTNKDRIALLALGKGQYRGKGTIDSGHYQATIGFFQAPVEFAAGDQGLTIFLYDNSDPKKPRLIIYSSALEVKK